MNLFLDDLRSPPDDSWTVARTYHEAVAILETGRVTHISFDHDLGDFGPAGYGGGVELTGYDVACWIERRVLEGRIPMPFATVHSANPVGAQRIKDVMRRLAERVG